MVVVVVVVESHGPYICERYRSSIGKAEVQSRVNGRSQVKWRWWWHILSCECSASGIYRIWEVPGR